MNDYNPLYTIGKRRQVCTASSSRSSRKTGVRTTSMSAAGEKHLPSRQGSPKNRILPSSLRKSVGAGFYLHIPLLAPTEENTPPLQKWKRDRGGRLRISFPLASQKSGGGRKPFSPGNSWPTPVFCAANRSLTDATEGLCAEFLGLKMPPSGYATCKRGEIFPVV
jgi:hypothetical protein